MPPLITDEQKDDLAARRRRKEAREAAAARNSKVSASPEAARDLLGGLITSGPGQSAGTTDDAADPNGGNTPPTRAREEDPGTPRVATAPTKPAREGEKIDQLIRRVREGTQTTGGEALATIQQRRPKGTADLGSDAAVPRRRVSRPRQLTTDAPRLKEARKRTTRRSGAAAMVLVAGIAVLAVVLSSAGGHGAAHAFDASASKTRFSSEGTAALGGALRASMAAIVPELQGLARQAAAADHAARPPHKAKREASSHARAARPRHQTATVVQSRTVATSSPPVAPSQEIQSSAPTPSPSMSQTSATPDTSTPSDSRPAGPTGSDPLGGLGSCVKGC